jgi:hypothetical protein
MEKKCTKCKQIKPIEEFYKRKNGIIYPRCKICWSEDCKEYTKKNKEKVESSRKMWVSNNRDKTRFTKTKWRKNNPEYHKNYYKKRVEEDPLYNSKCYSKDINKSREAAKRNRQRHPKYNQEYIKKKIKLDNNFRLARNMRHRIIYALRLAKTKKENTTTTLLGCSIIELKQHLESKFSPTMSWENYGKCWQVDHIIPCTLFNLSNKEEQRKCFHYTNLQPLFTVTTVIDDVEYLGNRNKGSRIINK